MIIPVMVAVLAETIIPCSLLLNLQFITVLGPEVYRLRPFILLSKVTSVNVLDPLRVLIYINIIYKAGPLTVSGLL